MPRTEEEELAELANMGISRKQQRAEAERRRNREREMAWNGSIHRHVPPALRGIKCATKEPWAIDQAFYEKKTGNMEPELNAQDPYFDESPLDNIAGYTTQVTASGLEGHSAGRPLWDSSPFRTVPYALRGLKPVMREPWAVDEKINRNQELEGFNVYSAKVEDDSVAGNFATRKRPKQPRRKKH